MGTLSQVGIAGVSTGILHPRHQNRFRVLFSGLGGVLGSSAGVPNDLSMQVITCTLPNLSFEEVVLDRYNSRAYVLGKHHLQLSFGMYQRIVYQVHMHVNYNDLVQFLQMKN